MKKYQRKVNLSNFPFLGEVDKRKIFIVDVRDITDLPIQKLYLQRISWCMVEACIPEVNLRLIDEQNKLVAIAFNVQLEEVKVEQPIKGYRILSEEEISLVNLIKASANDLEKFIYQIRSDPVQDQRWVSIAETHLQQGFMALVRAVTKPEGF